MQKILVSKIKMANPFQLQKISITTDKEETRLLKGNHAWQFIVLL